jgi:alpha-galactosidase/6-phospho-beta-glucosidase family protein
MPFIFDFDKCIAGIKKVTVSPKGWNSPITIEYGVAQANKYDTASSVVWRVSGTTHTFTIYELYINQISKSNYENHFTEVLERFREDYLSWFEDDKYNGCEWKDEYEKQYSKFIIKY